MTQPRLPSNYVSALFAKLGMGRRTQAVAYAVECSATAMKAATVSRYLSAVGQTQPPGASNLASLAACLRSI